MCREINKAEINVFVLYVNVYIIYYIKEEAV